MTDEKAAETEKTVETVMAPVTALVISGTGDGSHMLPREQLIETPPGQPDIVQRVITPFVAVFSRAGNAFLSAFLGAIGLGLTGAVPVSTLKLALYSGGSAALVASCQALITIFSNLEKRYPLLRA